MSSCLLGFNRSALGVKKMWSGYLMCDCLHPEVVRLVDPAKSIWGFGTSGTVASAPGQFIKTLDIAISLEHAISHGSNFEDYLWDSEIHRGCFQARLGIFLVPVEGHVLGHRLRGIMSNVARTFSPLAAPFRQRARRSHALFFPSLPRQTRPAQPPRRFLLRSAR